MINLWASFLDLLPTTPKRVGKISNDLGGFKYQVTLLDGGIVIAISQQAMSVGQNVFLQDGKILGQAPALPYLEIDI